MAEVENISDWSIKNVVNWFRGLDDSLQRYVPNLQEACITGAQLLALNYEDLSNLGITPTGHQELVLEATELLKQLTFNLDTENLQSHALNVNSICRALRSSISSQRRNPKYGSDSVESLQRGASVPILRMAASTLEHLRMLVMWLDRPPFVNRQDIKSSRANIVRLGYELSTTVQQTVFACVIEEAALAICSELEETTNQLIVSSDPMTIQPSSLEVVHLVNRDPSTGLGLFIKTTFQGYHVITGTKDGSISSKIRRIVPGDEVVAVAGQTVIGWQLSKLVSCLKSSPKDVAITLKKCPHFGSSSSSIPLVPRRQQPERVLTLPPPISPIQKSVSSRTKSLGHVSDDPFLTGQSHNNPQYSKNHSSLNKLKRQRAKSSENVRRDSHINPKITCSSGGKQTDQQRNLPNSCSDLSVSSSDGDGNPDSDGSKKLLRHRSLENVTKHWASTSPSKYVAVNQTKKKNQNLPDLQIIGAKKQSKLELHDHEESVKNDSVVFSPLDILEIPPPPEAPYTPRVESKLEVIEKSSNYSSSYASESPNSLMDIEQHRRYTVIGSEALDEKWYASMVTKVDSQKAKRTKDLILKELVETKNHEDSVLLNSQNSLNGESKVKIRPCKPPRRRPVSMPAIYYGQIKLSELRASARGSMGLNRTSSILGTMHDEKSIQCPVTQVNEHGVRKLAPLNYTEEKSTSKDTKTSDFSDRLGKSNQNNNNSKERPKVPPKPPPKSISVSQPANWKGPSSLDKQPERPSVELQPENECKMEDLCRSGAPNTEQKQLRITNEWTKPYINLLKTKSTIIPDGKIIPKKPTRRIRSQTELNSNTASNMGRISTELTKYYMRKKNEGVIPSHSSIDQAQDGALTNISPSPATISVVPLSASVTDTHCEMSKSVENMTFNLIDMKSNTVTHNKSHKVSNQNFKKRPIPSPRKLEQKFVNDDKLGRLRVSPTSRGSYVAAIDVGYAVENLRWNHQRTNFKNKGQDQGSESSNFTVTSGVHAKLHNIDCTKGFSEELKNSQLHPDMRSQRRISCRDLGKGECDGWLWKKKSNSSSPLASKWTKRWVILKEGAVYCYRTPNDEKAESFIGLPGYQITPAPECKKRFAFRVVHPRRKTFYFASERQMDMSKWMNKMGLAAIDYAFSDENTSRDSGGVEILPSKSDHYGGDYYSESDNEDAFSPSVDKLMTNQSISLEKSVDSIPRRDGSDFAAGSNVSHDVLNKSARFPGEKIVGNRFGDSRTSPEETGIDSNRYRSKSEATTSSNAIMGQKSGEMNTLNLSENLVMREPQGVNKHSAISSPRKKKKHRTTDTRRKQHAVVGPLSLSLESLNSVKAEEFGEQLSRSEEELRHLKNAAMKKAKQLSRSEANIDSSQSPDLLDESQDVTYEHIGHYDKNPNMHRIGTSILSNQSPKLMRRDIAGRPQLRIDNHQPNLSSESHTTIHDNKESSIDDLCRALQNAEVDIHGVNRRTTLRRKMTILSRDPKKNEALLKKRALQRQLKAFQGELEYYNHLLDQPEITPKKIHEWINQHPSLAANLESIRRMSERRKAEHSPDLPQPADRSTKETKSETSSTDTNEPIEFSESSVVSADEEAISSREEDLSHKSESFSRARPRSCAFSSNVKLPIKPRSSTSSPTKDCSIPSHLAKPTPNKKHYLETDL